MMVNQTVRQRKRKCQQHQQQHNSIGIQTTTTTKTKSSNQHQHQHQHHRTNNDDDDDNDDDDYYNNNNNNNNDNNDNTIIFQWIESIAIVGDSVYSLLAVTIILVLSIVISLNHNTIYDYYYNYYYLNNNQLEFTNQHSSNNVISTIQSLEENNNKKMKKTFLHVPEIKKDDDNNLYKKLGPIPKIDPPYIFTINLDTYGNIEYNNNNNNNNNNENENSNDNNNNDNYTKLFQKIHTAFYKDGVVAIRGLLSNNLLQQLDDESMTIIQDLTNKNKKKKNKNKKKQKKQNQFFTVQHRILFHNNKKTKNSNYTNNKQSLSAFAKVALRSAIPTFVAALHYNLTIQEQIQQQQQQQQQQIMMMSQKDYNKISANRDQESEKDNVSSSDSDEKNLRVIRDIFLAKDNGQHICGWHVDDMGFWPITQTSTNGINVWIAIDDIPLVYGGGFALAIQSHVAPWRTDAHIATGSSMYFPLPNGYNNALHMINNRTGTGTCNIQHIAPHIHQRMEDTSRIYNIRRGDIIIHTRWLFHRTIPFVINNNTNNDDDINSRIYRRYSIRYGPGSTSIISPGYGTEYSVLLNESFGGQSADDICTSLDNSNNTTPWYPLAWRWNNNNNNTTIVPVVKVKEEETNNSNDNNDTTGGDSKILTKTSISKKQIQEEEEDIILANQFDNMVQTKFPIVEKIAKQRQTEIQRLLIQQQQQQQQQQQRKQTATT